MASNFILCRAYQGFCTMHRGRGPWTLDHFSAESESLRVAGSPHHRRGAPRRERIPCFGGDEDRCRGCDREQHRVDHPLWYAPRSTLDLLPSALKSQSRCHIDESKRTGTRNSSSRNIPAYCPHAARTPCCRNVHSVRLLALSQSVWALKIDEPGLFPAAKMTDLYRKPSMSTSAQSMSTSTPVR